MASTVGPPSDTAAGTARRCPCGSGDSYDACCGRFHRGEADAPTAEALMRSRYTAFARRDAPYLLRTWHPRTRPAPEEVRLAPDQRWLRLDVLDTSGGGPFDDEGVVVFEARWRSGADRGVLRERSRFLRPAGEGPRRWLYLDGEVA